MNNTIFYLIGHAGVGKLTTAKAISAMTGARIIDNHYINNPIFNLIEMYRQEPLPVEVWNRVAEIRHAILETVAELSPREWSFVFTHVAFEEAEDIAIYRAVRDVAARRGARFQPVRLRCNIDELSRRITRAAKPAQGHFPGECTARRENSHPAVRGTACSRHRHHEPAA
jgi:predicted kinase